MLHSCHCAFPYRIFTFTCASIQTFMFAEANQVHSGGKRSQSLYMWTEVGCKGMKCWGEEYW